MLWHNGRSPCSSVCALASSLPSSALTCRRARGDVARRTANSELKQRAITSKKVMSLPFFALIVRPGTSDNSRGETSSERAIRRTATSTDSYGVAGQPPPGRARAAPPAARPATAPRPQPPPSDPTADARRDDEHASDEPGYGHGV